MSDKLSGSDIAKAAKAMHERGVKLGLFQKGPEFHAGSAPSYEELSSTIQASYEELAGAALQSAASEGARKELVDDRLEKIMHEAGAAASLEVFRKDSSMLATGEAHKAYIRAAGNALLAAMNEVK